MAEPGVVELNPEGIPKAEIQKAEQFLAQPEKTLERAMSAARAGKYYEITASLDIEEVRRKLAPEEIAAVQEYADLAGTRAGLEAREKFKQNPLRRIQESLYWGLRGLLRDPPQCET